MSLTELVKSASHIKLGKGALTKIVVVFVAGGSFVTGLAAVSQVFWLIAGTCVFLMIAMVATIAFAAWYTVKHPDAALMEGSEITHYRKEFRTEGKSSARSAVLIEIANTNAKAPELLGAENE